MKIRLSFTQSHRHPVTKSQAFSALRPLSPVPSPERPLSGSEAVDEGPVSLNRKGRLSRGYKKNFKNKYMELKTLLQHGEDLTAWKEVVEKL